MSKQVFSTEIVLQSSTENTLLKESLDIVENLRKEHPEFEKLLWKLMLVSTANGTSRVAITVTDQNATDHRETVKVFLGIAVMFLILVGLTYL
jgi:hypothetical protein